MSVYELAITNLKHIEPADFGPADCETHQLSPKQIHGTVLGLINRRTPPGTETQDIFEQVMLHLHRIEERIADTHYGLLNDPRREMLKASRDYLDHIKATLRHIILERDKTFSSTDYNFIDLMSLIFTVNEASKAKAAKQLARREGGRPPLAPRPHRQRPPQATRQQAAEAAREMTQEMKHENLLPVLHEPSTAERLFTYKRVRENPQDPKSPYVQAPTTSAEQQRLSILLEETNLRQHGEMHAQTPLVNDYHPTYGYVTGGHTEIHYTYRHTPAQRVQNAAQQNPGHSNNESLEMLHKKQLSWIKKRIKTLLKEKNTFFSTNHKRKDIKLAILNNLKERLAPSHGTVNKRRVITSEDITHASQVFIRYSANTQKLQDKDVKSELYKGGIFKQSRTFKLQRLSEIGDAIAIAPRAASAA
ncbi:MAG: hypothetical protein P1U34_01700 [Coxiellaceae bacterium]|nr:hypothetical protein [Coxiellaceae bacterium]